MSNPVTKLSLVRAAMAAGNELEALRVAAKFPQLGEHATRITRGWAAHTRPEFYRAIGKDPAALVADGVAAIRERYEMASKKKSTTTKAPGKAKAEGAARSRGKGHSFTWSWREDREGRPKRYDAPDGSRPVVPEDISNRRPREPKLQVFAQGACTECGTRTRWERAGAREGLQRQYQAGGAGEWGLAVPACK